MENSEKMNCPYCGAELDSNVGKCRYCGEWVKTSEENLPQDLKHFNWGAFLLNWIWGIMHGKYITLLYFAACIIPVIGPLAISIWFGIAGNKWAWNSRSWDSVEQFNRVQRNYVKVWIVLAVLGIIISVKIFVLLMLISNIQL